MKIFTLNLRAFGPFTDVEIDLSEGSEGLHLVYGPNEAGKTCALRALEQLLFGIPANSPDNFVHPYPKLRIGAKLLGRDGRQLEFFRRKGTKRTLLGPDDQTPLDEAVLQRFLGGLDRGTFATMFGIGHERLREGGREMARGGGQLGQSLFGAGAGIANLRAVQEGLNRESDQLFKPGGKVPAINKCLAQLAEARKAIRNAELRPARRLERENALAEANRRLAEVESRLIDLSRCKSRCERIRDALPLVGRRKEILRQQADLGDVPILPDDFAEQRRGADATLRAARMADETAREAIGQIDAQIESIVVPDALLAQAEVIEEVHQKLGSYRKAQTDRPILLAQRQQLESDARHVLQELDPKLSIEFADRLRLTSPQKVEIQNLGNRCEALANELRQAQQHIEDSRSDLAEVERAIAELPLARDPAALKDAVRRTQPHGDSEQHLAGARIDLTRLEEQAAADLEKLPLWSGPLDQLERLAVPSAETVDRSEDQLAECDQQLALLRRNQRGAEDRRAECERRLDQLEREGDVPTEKELVEARRVRDLGWQLVLEAWRHGEPNADGLREFLDHFPAETDLAAAYQQAVQTADQLADRLRREASRVAQLAQLQASRQTTQRELDELAGQRNAAEEDRRRAEHAWNECWQPLGVTPRSPREMRTWLERQRALASQAEAIRNARANVRVLEARIERCRRELGGRLGELDVPTDSASESLSALLGRCQAVVDQLDELANRRERLTADRAKLHKSVADAEAVRKRAQREMEQWRDQWATAIERLSLPPDTTPAAANEVLARINDLFACLKHAEGLSLRIEGIDRDAEQFQGEVRALVDEVAPDLASLPVDRQAREVYARWQKAVRDDEKLGQLRRQRTDRLKERDHARRTIDEQIALLDAMCQEAGVPRHEDLSEAIQRSDQKRRLLEELKDREGRLLELAGGAAIEDFAAEVELVDADEVPGRLKELCEAIEVLEAEKGDLREIRGREQNVLETMDTSTAAADANEHKEDLLAQIESDARQYARLRLASVVLSEAMERYRKKHEDPILRRASELFHRLTLGSFESLRTDVDDQGRDVLAGTRPGETAPVHLDGMSEGTCDQLYLALRLASLESHLDGNEPIPFVVDDVLISFDDDRATAALGVLAELSQRTQIVFFTHHLHLVRLAEENLDRAVLFVHRLPGREPAGLSG
ncbi:MAG TPA: AAA family ATPase [Thermoguttaceae bacterium]|nr:AAA family ATPase [Thermoguttaceae bacterium]